MDHGILFGIFQICKEESPTLAAPGLQKVATNSGKQRWEFSEQPYCSFRQAVSGQRMCAVEGVCSHLISWSSLRLIYSDMRLPFPSPRIAKIQQPGGAPRFQNISPCPRATPPRAR